MAASDEILKELREEIRELKKTQTIISKSCENMNRHIVFVECVYSTVRQPLNWLLFAWQRTFARLSMSSKSLPMLKNTVFESEEKRDQ